ncbi:WW domain-containing transcription regulator protein 1 [Aplochiton taeniatus]
MNLSPHQPMPGQQVIHVAQDSDTDLEALFNSVMKPKPSSWRKKHLPESFFKEPDSGSHSRQSSTDSGSHPPRLPVQHVRSYSSPASLQLGSPGTPTPSPVHHSHIRHQSFDVAEELALPPGWEMAYTSNGQKYFLNHVEKITTWQDPRKSMTSAMTQMSLHHNPAPTPPAHTQPRSMALSQPNLVMTQQHQQQQQQQQQHHHHHHQQQQLQHQVQQAQAQAQAQTLASPGSLAQQHSSQSGLLGLGGPLGAGAGVGPQQQQQQQQQQQKMRLQRIQLERERIQRRQEELMRQEAALCRQLPMDSDSLGSSLPSGGGVQNNSIPSGADPFLNSGHFQHSRDQSTDSGLGLGCYSVPTTPEDFLNSMEDMDTGEALAVGSLSMPSGVQHQPSRFPDFLDSLPGTNVDLGTLEGSDLMPILNDVESVLSKTEPFLTWL